MQVNLLAPSKYNPKIHHSKLVAMLLSGEKNSKLPAFMAMVFHKFSIQR